MSDRRRTDDPDQKRRYFRASDRFFKQNDDWYFATREGEQGPFPNERVARAEYGTFALLNQFSARIEENVMLKPRPSRNDVWDGQPDVD